MSAILFCLFDSTQTLASFQRPSLLRPGRTWNATRVLPPPPSLFALVHPYQSLYQSKPLRERIPGNEVNKLVQSLSQIGRSTGTREHSEAFPFRAAVLSL